MEVKSDPLCEGGGLRRERTTSPRPSHRIASYMPPNPGDVKAPSECCAAPELQSSDQTLTLRLAGSREHLRAVSGAQRREQGAMLTSPEHRPSLSPFRQPRSPAHGDFKHGFGID